MDALTYTGNKRRNYNYLSNSIDKKFRLWPERIKRILRIKNLRILFFLQKIEIVSYIWYNKNIDKILIGKAKRGVKLWKLK